MKVTDARYESGKTVHNGEKKKRFLLRGWWREVNWSVSSHTAAGGPALRQAVLSGETPGRRRPQGGGRSGLLAPLQVSEPGENRPDPFDWTALLPPP